MNWVTQAFSTSVGKKQLMAVTGLLFLLFLTTHLLGNLSIYGGTAGLRRLRRAPPRPGETAGGGGNAAWPSL